MPKVRTLDPLTRAERIVEEDKRRKKELAEARVFPSPLTEEPEPDPNSNVGVPWWQR